MRFLKSNDVRFLILLSLCASLATAAGPNLLVNGNFDDPKLDPWVVVSGARWEPKDADDAPPSGSLYGEATKNGPLGSQCVSVTTGALFEFGAHINMVSGRGTGEALVDATWFDTPGCAGRSLGGSQTDPLKDLFDVFVPVSRTGMDRPPTAQSVLVRLIINSDNGLGVFFDNAYFRSSAAAGSADLFVEKTGNEVVTLGSTVDYAIGVINNGKDDATNVRIIDDLPDGMNFDDVDRKDVCDQSPDKNVVCNLASLKVGEKFDLRIRAKPDAVGTYVNNVTVSADQTDPKPQDNTSDWTTRVDPPPSADLAIAKTVTPPSGVVGAQLSYTLTIRNNGPAPASGIDVVDIFSAPVVFDDVTQSQGSCNTPNQTHVTCTLGSLASGATANVRIVVKPQTSGTLINDYTVNGAEADPNQGNNVGRLSTQITAPQADLGISKLAPATIAAEGAFTYTINVSNKGPQSANAVRVVDNLDSRLAFNGSSGSGWTCTLAGRTLTCDLASPLPAGGLAQGLLQMTAPPEPALISNTATVSWSGNDPIGNNNSSTVATQVTGRVDLSVSKTDSPDPVLVGGTLTYTILVSNAGPSTATNVMVLDPLPAQTAFGSVTTTQGSCGLAGLNIGCALGSLAPGANAVVTLVVQPTSSGTLSNTATASAVEIDLNPLNNSDTEQTTVGNFNADLSITKLDTPDPVFAGGTLTYTIQVTNNGPDAASSVVVTDTLPAGVTLISAGGNGWSCTPGSGTVICTKPTLAVGPAEPIIIVVTAPSDNTTLTNSVSVSSSTNDPKPNDNSAVQRTTVVVKVADLTLIKTASPQRLPVNGALQYRLDVSNAGPETATSVVIEDSLPSGVELVSVSPAGLCTFTTPVRCNVGSLPSGSVATVFLNVIPRAAGTIENRATVSATEVDPTPLSNSSAVTVIVDPENDLGITKAGPSNVAPGGTIAYQIKVHNGSSLPVNDVGVSDSFPPQLQTVSWSCTASAGSNCDAPSGTGSISTTVDLAANGIATFTASATVAAGTTGTVTNTASITIPAGVIDPIPGNNTSTTTANVVCGQLAQPRNLSALRIIASGKRFLLSWTSVADAASYRVRWSASPDMSSAESRNVEGTETEFLFTVEQTRAFYFQVEALAECDPNAGSQSEIIRVVVVHIPVATVDRPPLVTLPFGQNEVITLPLLIEAPAGAAKNALDTNFTAATDKAWLTIVPASGTIPPGGTTFAVTANSTALPVGTTTGTVVITSGTGAQIASVPVSINLATPVTAVGKELPSPNSLIIPAVAHSEGLTLVEQSDIRFMNITTRALKYQLIFTPSRIDALNTPKKSEVDLEGGQTTAINDVVKSWFGAGALGETATGTLEIRPVSTDPSERNAVGSSRLFTVSDNGSIGQFIPAIPFSKFVAKPATGQPRKVLSLQQIAQSTAYRTTLGLVEAAGFPTTVRVFAFNDDGAKLGEWDIELQAGEHRRLENFLAQKGISLSDGRFEVEVISGVGKVMAYASVLDQATNDPLLVTGIDPSSVNANRFSIPGVAAYDNVFARWRTDLRLYNASTSPAIAQMSFHETDESTAAKTVSITVNPGEVKALDNVLVNTFGLNDAGGVIHVTTQSVASLIATARTYDLTETGTIGQFIRGVTPNDAIGAENAALQILQVEESAQFRTNLGLVEVTGQTARVEISAVLPDSKAETKLILELQPNEFKQMVSVMKLLNLGTTYNGRLAIRVIGGGGRIAAYGSMIDNLTQDATYVDAQ